VTKSFIILRCVRKLLTEETLLQWDDDEKRVTVEHDDGGLVDFETAAVPPDVLERVKVGGLYRLDLTPLGPDQKVTITVLPDDSDGRQPLAADNAA
jgi:hypothetical protein